MDCDDEKHRRAIQVEAGLIAFRRTEDNLLLLSRWYMACVQDPEHRLYWTPSELKPELPGFIQHRDDQSVLTNLIVDLGIRTVKLPAEFIKHNVPLNKPEREIDMRIDNNFEARKAMAKKKKPSRVGRFIERFVKVIRPRKKTDIRFAGVNTMGQICFEWDFLKDGKTLLKRFGVDPDDSKIYLSCIAQAMRMDVGSDRAARRKLRDDNLNKYMAEMEINRIAHEMRMEAEKNILKGNTIGEKFPTELPTIRTPAREVPPPEGGMNV
jgi:hypothetical protein